MFRNPRSLKYQNYCHIHYVLGNFIGELSSWIQMGFKHYKSARSFKQQFLEYDKNSDGSVSWDE